ncbi:gamma-glutamyltransferase [Rubricoccus marinus]|uniref:Glutathione hydrolase proenzyme n=2 Tax=Rubricoccus marinus TaxID=716817 RepID=A0A259U450_9BACT|nr:gamma-glutamyltransferase [Rubricoccus marinus]
MVVSAEVNASTAGVEILKAGGNAVDAAVATGFALAVTFPIAGNIGGGGFMVIRMPDGTATTIDYRETAPAASTRDMFLDSTGTYVPERSRVGTLASGVPGAVAGLLMAHERYGSLPLAQVMAPAIRLAEGYALSREQAERFNGYRPRFETFASTAKYFAPEAGFGAGETFRQGDLAAVLKRIAARGRDGFYRGETADLLVAEMERGGGLITHADLAAYRAVEREAVRGSYRGYGVISMPPPSSGGVALVQLLRSVEPYDLRAMGFNSSATVHLMAEAMRRVYADRAEWLGDPDFTPVPVSGLTGVNYVRERMADFNPYRADTSATVSYGVPLAGESDETTHYSVVDAGGMAVSTTTTLNGGYGSMLVVDGAGFFLNNEMDDFAAAPGVPNMFGLVGTEANAVGPGKRMLSSMTPTILETPEGELFMVIGSPGGARIITTVFQVILNVIDHEMHIQAAVAAPRIHHQWLPDVLYAERQSLSADVFMALEQRGWSVREGGRWSRADGIVVAEQASGVADDPSGLTEVETVVRARVLLGGADPRGEDTAVGY